MPTASAVLTSISGNINATGSATASRNGQLSGPITVLTPAPGSCPSHNMRVVLISVTYDVVFTLDPLAPYPFIGSYSR